MGDVRRATTGDLEVLAGIAAAGFVADPLMSWVFPDPTTRLDRLTVLFRGLGENMLPDRGVVHVVDDACAAFWRDPSFEHGAQADDDTGDDATDATEHDGGAAEAVSPWTEDELARLAILGEMMGDAHPHDAHWYLNVVATLPARQGQGLAARVLAPVLAECDANAMPAYLESSNPRNMTLYRRHGFVESGEIVLPDGPSLYPMWRQPAVPGRPTADG